MHYSLGTYDSIDGALGAVARSSIGCQLIVEPLPGGGYIVGPDWDVLPADGTFYDYALGVVTFEGEQLPGDYRVVIFEPYEFIDSPAQVRNYLPEAVVALEAGLTVGFAYDVLELLTHDDCDDPDLCDCSAGWVLMARV